MFNSVPQNQSITLANHSRRKQRMNQSELDASTCNLRQARENACEQITIGFSFTSDWLRKWREFFLSPITERIRAKPKQTQIIFDTELRTTHILKTYLGNFVQFRTCKLPSEKGLKGLCHAIFCCSSLGCITFYEL